MSLPLCLYLLLRFQRTVSAFTCLGSSSFAPQTYLSYFTLFGCLTAAKQVAGLRQVDSHHFHVPQVANIVISLTLSGRP